MPPTRRAKFGIALALLVLLAVPLPRQIVPAWPLRLVDQNGQPQAGLKTTQTWRHPVYRPEAQAETLYSDAQGRLAFPERTLRVSGWRYLYGLAIDLAEHGTDAAFSPDVWVNAEKDSATGGGNFFTPGQTPPDTVVIRPYGLCPTANIY